MAGPSEAQKPFTLLVLIRWPSGAAINIGTNAREHKYTPFQHTLNVFSHSSRSSRRKLPAAPIPALLNRRWMWSVRCSRATASRNASTCGSSETSASVAVTRVPRGAPRSHSARVCAIASSETSHIAT